MDRCPNCKARLDGADDCRRCGMALGPLVATERAAAVALRQAVARLAAGDHPGATLLLRRSLALHRTPLAAALAGFAAASDAVAGAGPDAPVPATGAVGAGADAGAGTGSGTGENAGLVNDVGC